MLLFYKIFKTESLITDSASTIISPVSSLTTSSNKFLPIKCLDWLVLYSEIKPKALKISKLVEKPIALSRIVAGNFLLRSMIAYMHQKYQL